MDLLNSHKQSRLNTNTRKLGGFQRRLSVALFGWAPLAVAFSSRVWLGGGSGSGVY